MLIINADDFGMNEHCSKAIAEAFLRRLVSDTTMMANGEYFEEALLLARGGGFEGKIGIHLNLTEGEPLTGIIRNMPRFVSNGRFNRKYDGSSPLSGAEREAVYAELSAQVEKLVNAGVSITHADSHHYVHNMEYIAPIAEQVCRGNGINKLRLQRNAGGISESEKKKARGYRACLRARGFVTTDYFMRMSDIDEVDFSRDTEILVHPDFDINGTLIDRHGIRDGFPFGEKLEKPVAALGSYAEL